jgi:NitT/TauT family transport system substrate-binding protein
MTKRNWLLLAAAGMSALIICGYGGAARGEERVEPLRVALLPIPDVLPFHVAREKGYFAAEGIAVQGLPVFSSLDRDQLMQAGQLDAMLTELATTANFNRSGVRVKIVCIARQPVAAHSLFRILSGPGTGIRSLSDLRGATLGISKNTVIEYVTDRLLSAAGLNPDRVQKKSVPVIPERYQLLMHGQIKAATLPEPLASSALAAGAHQIIADADNPRYSISVISFSTEALLEKPAAVRAFLRAWSRAAADITADPEAYRRVMLASLRVPDNVRERFPVPVFPPPRIPDKGQWSDVMDWMISKNLLTKPLPYANSVTAAYLPER